MFATDARITIMNAMPLAPTRSWLVNATLMRPVTSAVMRIMPSKVSEPWRSSRIGPSIKMIEKFASRWSQPA